jgi:DNA (cytosine-5)-methyltransferase 1
VSRPPFTAWEFFAGGGMARLGLASHFHVTFANDFDPVKTAAYRANFGGEHLHPGDIHALTPADLPGRADLAWASSPCQDFSLAGARAGLGGGRSSALLGFLRLIADLEDRAPPLLVIENVPGLLTARGGADFGALQATLTDLGYQVAHLLLDAAAFLPQSRPRLFIVAELLPLAGGDRPRSGQRREVSDRLPASASARAEAVSSRKREEITPRLSDILDPAAPWSPAAQTARLLALLNPLHRARLTVRPCTALAYRRVRTEHGRRVQRLELRTDGLAGCLRTPAGGSSRQIVLSWDGAVARSRLLTPREGARLMGLPDSYLLPAGDTAAWRVVGDGVAVPVVRWLTQHVLAPVLLPQPRTALARA